jgi:hypothetical protein
VDQIGFQPPDQDWRAALVTLNNLALNVYLIELRENRRLRSNERVPEYSGGLVTQTPAARRIDCHYLITAWSGAVPQLHPTVEEHRLLYNTVGALMRNDPLRARKIFHGAFPLGFPAVLEDLELPTTILPVDGFAKFAEFWGTMQGNVHPWRPAAYLILTLPVLLETELPESLVTTRIAKVWKQGAPPDILIEIGGHVFDATVAPETPVADAWVRLEDAAGVPIATTTTNKDGEFQFARLHAGTYRLQWRSGAHAAQPPRVISVPSPTGEYDLRFI